MTLQPLDKPPIYEDVKRLTERVAQLEKRLLPLEPLFDTEVVARLIPVEVDRLRDYMRRAEAKAMFKPRYRKDRRFRRLRVWTPTEVLTLRKHFLSGPGLDDVI